MGADNAAERVIAKMVADGRMRPREEKVFVLRGGTITALYDDTLAGIPGTKHVERVSDVEWDNDAQGWFASIRGDMTKECTCVSAPPCARSKTLLGPFPTRDEALRAEIEFIQARL